MKKARGDTPFTVRAASGTLEALRIFAMARHRTLTDEVRGALTIQAHRHLIRHLETPVGRAEAEATGRHPGDDLAMFTERLANLERAAFVPLTPNESYAASVAALAPLN